MKKIVLLTVSIILYMAGCEKPAEEPFPNEKINNDTSTLNDTVNVNDTILTETCAGDTYYTCKLTPLADSVYRQLLDAYNDSCVSCLQDVLDNWAAAYEPRTDIPDSLKKVYEVYKTFYSPWDLGRISNSEFGHRIYEEVSYYVIQSSIRYDFKFSYPDQDKFHFPDGTEYNVSDFRPVIANDTILLLYLTDAYKNAINCLLGSEYEAANSGQVMSPKLPHDEIYKRYEFLNNHLYFFHGHWHNYWHMETHPEVHTISFNETTDSAQVRFRLGYQGGEAILAQQENEWIIVDHYMTWIE